MTRQDYPPGKGPARGIVYSALIGLGFVAVFVIILTLAGYGS